MTQEGRARAHIPEEGRETGRERNRAKPPTPWPFPLWNGIPVPKPKRKVARKMPPEFSEDAPF